MAHALKAIDAGLAVASPNSSKSVTFSQSATLHRLQPLWVLIRCLALTARASVQHDIQTGRNKVVTPLCR